MGLFIAILIITLAASVIFTFLTIKSYKRIRINKKNRKYNLFDDSERKKDNNSLLMSVCGFFISVIGVILTLLYAIPAPIIYPLDNETRIYSDNTEIIIESDGFDIYYSLDGSDPKNGKKYENSIIITESTTISARSKFLWKWSDIATRAYIYPDEALKSTQTKQSIPDSTLQPIKKPTPTPEPTPISTSQATAEPTSIPTLEPTPVPTAIPQTTPEPTSLPTLKPTVEPTVVPTPEPILELTPVPTTPEPEPTEQPIDINGWLNLVESTKLIDYINHYRESAEVEKLVMDEKLEEKAEILAISYATGFNFSLDYLPENIGIISNESDAKNVADNWMTSDSGCYKGDILYKEEFRYIGCAVYYSPEGDEDGFHYFWVICLQ